MSRATVGALVLMVAVLGACSDSDSSKAGSVASAVADAPASDTTGGASSAAGSFDCDAIKDTMGGFMVNTQLVVQLGSQADVAQWPTDIGTMPEFATQLEALKVLQQYDDGVADTLTFFEGANDIAQRGYAGDAAAAGELAAYIGPDLAVVLSKQIPLGMALDAAGC